MLRSISAEQFKEWQIFEQLEPFESEKNAYRFALLTRILANVYRDPKKRSEPWSLDDCMYKFGDDPVENPAPVSRQKDWRLMKSIAQSIAQDRSRLNG